MPPAGLNRVRYKNADVDRFIDGAAAATNEDQRRALYAQAQQRIAQDVPYIALWYKTNVAIFQPDIHGVTLSPIADFTFLRGVYRQPAGGGSGS
jgi:ABC-type transport system substrate-binding protein